MDLPTRQEFSTLPKSTAAGILAESYSVLASQLRWNGVAAHLGPEMLGPSRMHLMTLDLSDPDVVAALERPETEQEAHFRYRSWYYGNLASSWLRWTYPRAYLIATFAEVERAYAQIVPPRPADSYELVDGLEGLVE